MGRPRNDEGQGVTVKGLSIRGDLLQEMQSEARRMDRSLSWIMRRCWRLARKQIRSLPAMPEPRGSK